MTKNDDGINTNNGLGNDRLHNKEWHGVMVGYDRGAFKYAWPQR